MRALALAPAMSSSGTPKSDLWCTAQKVLETHAALHYVAPQHKEF
jgi:hypothetical protein